MRTPAIAPLYESVSHRGYGVTQRVVLEFLAVTQARPTDLSRDIRPVDAKRMATLTPTQLTCDE